MEKIYYETEEAYRKVIAMRFFNCSKCRTDYEASKVVCRENVK